MAIETDLLTPAGPDRTGSGDGPFVVTLVHNERNLVVPFLAHYRSIGPVRFVIVDDRSTDGTREALSGAPDVTLLSPREGSRYDLHKALWRQQVLDRLSAGRWAMVPDIDEHLVWSGMDARPLDAVIAGLERDAADAAYCIMVDMYRDAPLAGHVFEGGSLRAAFPLFDDPGRDPLGTRMEAAPSGYGRDWPTPSMLVIGGMRQRLFGQRRMARGGWRDRVAQLLPPIRDPAPGPGRMALERIVRRLTDERRAERPISLVKLALLKWRPGSTFAGGPHAIRPAHTLGRERLALLHYPVTRGMAGIAYTAGRGQHARGAVHYREIAASPEALRSPVYDGTARYEGPESLSAFFGTGGET